MRFWNLIFVAWLRFDVVFTSFPGAGMQPIIGGGSSSSMASMLPKVFIDRDNPNWMPGLQIPSVKARYEKIYSDVRCDDFKLFKGTVSTMQACQQQCTDDERCKFMAFWIKSKYCETYPSCETRSEDNGKKILLYRRIHECQEVIKNNDGMFYTLLSGEFPDGIVRQRPPMKNINCYCTAWNWMLCAIFVIEGSNEDTIVRQRLNSAQNERDLKPFFHPYPALPDRPPPPLMFTFENSESPIRVFGEIEIVGPSKCGHVNQCLKGTPNGKCPVEDTVFHTTEAVFILESDVPKVASREPLMCISAIGIRKLVAIQKKDPSSQMAYIYNDPFGRESGKILEVGRDYRIVFLFDDDAMAEGICQDGLGRLIVDKSEKAEDDPSQQPGSSTEEKGKSSGKKKSKGGKKKKGSVLPALEPGSPVHEPPPKTEPSVPSVSVDAPGPSNLPPGLERGSPIQQPPSPKTQASIPADEPRISTSHTPTSYPSTSNVPFKEPSDTVKDAPANILKVDLPMADPSLMPTVVSTDTPETGGSSDAKAGKSSDAGPSASSELRDDSQSTTQDWEVVTRKGKGKEAMEASKDDGKNPIPKRDMDNPGPPSYPIPQRNPDASSSEKISFQEYLRRSEGSQQRSDSSLFSPPRGRQGGPTQQRASSRSSTAGSLLSPPRPRPAPQVSQTRQQHKNQSEGGPSRNWADIVSPPRARPNAGSSSSQGQSSSWKDVVALPQQPTLPRQTQWTNIQSSARRPVPPQPLSLPPGLYIQTTKEELPYDRVTLKLKTGRSVSKRAISNLNPQETPSLDTNELSQLYEKSRKDDSPERGRPEDTWHRPPTPDSSDDRQDETNPLPIVPEEKAQTPPEVRERRQQHRQAIQQIYEQMERENSRKSPASDPPPNTQSPPNIPPIQLQSSSSQRDAQAPPVDVPTVSVAPAGSTSENNNSVDLDSEAEHKSRRQRNKMARMKKGIPSSFLSDDSPSDEPRPTSSDGTVQSPPRSQRSSQLRPKSHSSTGSISETDPLSAENVHVSLLSRQAEPLPYRPPSELLPRKDYRVQTDDLPPTSLLENNSERPPSVPRFQDKSSQTQGNEDEEEEDHVSAKLGSSRLLIPHSIFIFIFIFTFFTSKYINSFLHFYKPSQNVYVEFQDSI